MGAKTSKTSGEMGCLRGQDSPIICRHRFDSGTGIEASLPGTHLTVGPLRPNYLLEEA
ncbi:MAG TPA: hypothetical protein VJV96_13840 [Candidatus Angelobacter sp.]|jgi:hypothetical protein|nr:hypothetical protein [Candidatus Angelobacter sp.]